MADTTAGFSPRSTAPAVITRAASMMYAFPPMRAIASSTPSNRPIERRNCWRTRPYAPVVNAHILAVPQLLAGSEIERPAARAFMSIFQPCPTYSTPPITHSIGTNTSLPQVGPFMNAASSGKCRRPTRTPGVCVGISASVMPSSSCSPST